jgi:hypothetical protein
MLTLPKVGLFILASTLLRRASHTLLSEQVAAEVGGQQAVDQPVVAVAAGCCRPQSTLLRDQLTLLLLALVALAAWALRRLHLGAPLPFRGQTFRQLSRQVAVMGDIGAQQQFPKTQWREVLAGAQVAFHLEQAQALLELTGRVIRAEIRRRFLLVAPLRVVAALVPLVETQFLLA